MSPMNVLKNYFALPLELRTWLMTEGCMLINVALAIYNGFLGIVNHSDLLLVLSFFYALLAFMRFFLGESIRTFFKKAGEDRLRGTLLLSGMLMIILGMILNSIFVTMVEKNEAADFTNYSTLVFIIFAVSKIVMTGYGLNLSRKQKDPIFSLIQRTTLTETLFCSYSLLLSLIPCIASTIVQERVFTISGNFLSGFVIIMGIINVASSRKYKSSVNDLNIPTYDEVNLSRR